MAAMASQQEQPQGQPQQPQQDPNAQGGDGGSQEMFEAIAEGPLTYIYSEEGLASIKQMMTASDEDDAEEVISEVAGKLMVGQALEARNQGKMIPPSVMFALCMELVNNITDIAVQIGVVDKANADVVGEEAFFDAVAVFGENADELAINDQERTQYATMIDEMSQLMEQQSGKPQPSDAEKDDQFDNEEV